VIERDDSETIIDSPADFPDSGEMSKRKISHVLEPMIRATIVTPDEFTGGVMELCAVRDMVFVTLSEALMFKIAGNRSREESRSLSSIWTAMQHPPRADSGLAWSISFLYQVSSAASIAISNLSHLDMLASTMKKLAGSRAIWSR
jgi:hypothetical protein